MRLDAARLRSRRLQLGLTTRGLARETGVSRTLITRLEDSGDPDNLTCATLQRILDALSLDLVDAIADVERSGSSDDSDLERLGAILLTQTSAMTSRALAHAMKASEEELAALLRTLGEQVRPAGIRVHRGGTSVRLVPTANLDTDAARRQSSVHAVTAADLRLLHRVLRSGGVHRRKVATPNGNVSLYRLERLRLVEIRGDGRIYPGPAATEALQLL